MKKYFLFFLFVFAIFRLCAQELPVVVPKSPEAAVLSKYSEFPVGTFTGVPSINIPLYTIESGDITIPIELSYHAGGFRVNEEAGWVGLGWSLSTNAIITREVHGADDFTGRNTSVPYLTSIPILDPDGLNGFAGSERIGGYSEQRKNSPNAMANGKFIENYPGIGMKLDWEPDIFTINCFGHNGKFVLDQSGNAFFLEKTDLTLDPTSKGWSMGTSDGFHYYFETTSKTTDYLGYDVSSSWYLTKIISPSGDSATFSYVDNNVETTTHSYSEHYNLLYGNNNSSYILENSFTGTKYVEKYLDVIVFATGFAKFINAERSDLEGGKKLSSILIRRTNNEITKEILFRTNDFIADDQRNGYLYNNPTIDYSCYSRRLRLNSVTVKQGTDSSCYKFDYSNVKLPKKDSYSIDHWGYYNGAPNTQLIPAFEGELPFEKLYHEYTTGWDEHLSTSELISLESAEVYSHLLGSNREPNKATMGACILEKITYPTGGSTSFKFEANDYGNPEIQSDVERYEYINFSANVDITCSSTGAPIIYNSLTFPYTFPSDIIEIIDPEIQMAVIPWNTTDYTQCISLTSNSWFQISMDGFDYYGTPDGFSGRYYFNDLDNDVTTNPSCNFTSHSLNISNQMVKFTGPLNMSIYIDPNLTHENKRAFFAFNCKLKRRVTYNPDENKNAGGLRIKSITYYDGLDTARNIVKTYDYYTDLTTDQGIVKKSTGILKIPVKYYYVYRKVPPIEQSLWTDVMFTSSSIMSLSYNQYSNIGYTQVTETTGSSSENGKIVYNYKNMQNDCFFQPYRPSGVISSSQWLPFDGKLLDKTVYNNLGDTISKNVYKYELKEEKILKGIFQDGFLYAFGSLPYTRIGNGCLHYYPIYCRWEALSGTDEYLFNTDDPTRSIKNQTSYYYGGKKHVQPTSISKLNSENIPEIQLNKFAGDYLIRGCDDDFYQCEIDYQNNLNTCISNFWNQYLNSPVYKNCAKADTIRDQACRDLYPVNVAKYYNSLFYTILMHDYHNDTTLVGEKIRQQAFMDVLDCHGNSNTKYTECTTVISEPLLAERENCIRTVEGNYSCPQVKDNCIENYENQLTDQAKIISELGKLRPAALVESIKLKDNQVQESTLQLYGYAGKTGAGKTILPVETNTLKSLQPTNFTYSSFDDYNFTTDSRYEPRIKLTYYDNGNIKEAWKTDDIVTTYIWSYNNSYPIAKIDNANFAVVQTVLGGSSALDNFSKKQYPTNAEIDTFLAPLFTNALLKNSMVTTYTYKPLIGITSQTDPNGITTKYEYDNLGRLNLIRDADGNILKTYKYHYNQ